MYSLESLKIIYVTSRLIGTILALVILRLNKDY